MKPEITRQFLSPGVPGSQQHLRLRRDTDGTYSMWIGGAPAGSTPGTWGGISGLTVEMVAALPMMFDQLLAGGDDRG